MSLVKTDYGKCIPIKLTLSLIPYNKVGLFFERENLL